MINQQKFTDFFANITEEKLNDLNLLKTIYSNHCTFKDPFNVVNNVEHIQRIYLHSYKHFAHVRFILDNVFWKNKLSQQSEQAILVWRFELNNDVLENNQIPKFNIKGTSLLTFKDDLIVFHEDFWDPVEGLWSKIPIIKKLMKFLNQKLKIQ